MKLKTRFLVYFAPLCATAGATTVWLSHRALHQLITQEVANRVLVNADYIGEGLAPEVARRREQGILPLLQTHMSRAGAAYAVVLDTAGVVLAHSNVSEKGKVYHDPLTLRAVDRSKPGYRQTVADGKPCLDIALPIVLAARGENPESELLFSGKSARAGVRVGTMRMGIPLERTMETERVVLQRFIFIFASIFLFALVLGLIFLNAILEPIFRLSEATQNMKRGDYGAQLPVRSKDELGELVSHFNQMSAELSQSTRQLESQARELARSNSELENFAHVASHDLQEPLRMVTSYLQLLSKESHAKLTASGREYLEFALDGAKRMKALIDALLAYSRVESRGGNFVLTDCNLLIGHAIRNLMVTIEESGARITNGPLPTLPVDAVQVTELFQNLISNAIKFRGEEPPHVHISAREESGVWTFAVEDNGIGIDPRDFERIFVIFQRIHDRDQYPGTGIGLAVCKKIVERHGGRIWLRSEPGKGTAFFFTLQPPGGAVAVPGEVS